MLLRDKLQHVIWCKEAPANIWQACLKARRPRAPRSSWAQPPGLAFAGKGKGKGGYDDGGCGKGNGKGMSQQWIDGESGWGWWQNDFAADDGDGDDDDNGWQQRR